MEQKISDKSISCFIQKSVQFFPCHFLLKEEFTNATFLKRILRWIFISLLLILFSTVIFSLKSYGVPAYDGLFEMKQPSGFSFEARQLGDEWYNWVETKDGYAVYKNTITDNWEYYLPSADTDSTEVGSKGHLGRIQDSPPPRAIVGEADPFTLGIPKGLRPPKTSVVKPQSFALDQNISPQKSLQTELEGRLKSAAVSGAMHLLVIAVDYSNATATYTADQIQPLLFGASNSVSDYYSKTSYSSVTISPATESHGTSNDGFIGWLRLSGNHPNTGSTIDTRNQQIAKSAILAADPYINYAQYDANGNGVIEPTELSVMIIVAGYEAATSSNPPSVWAHQWWMGSVGFPSVDGKFIHYYAQFGENHGGHLATFGVMAHELGHLMFGLPDLYDTDTSNGDSSGVGFFDLMGGGSWGAVSGAYGGSSPTQLSAWSKEYLSWGIVNTISSSQSVSFPKTDGNSSSIFRVNTLDSNQYFLIENRQFTGYDIGFQGATGASGHGGLVIYHIDSSKFSNADENDKMVDVEEANEGNLGYSMLDTKSSAANTNMFFFSGNNTSFTDATTPSSKLKNGNSTLISITDISNYGDTMTAAIVLPTTLQIGDRVKATANLNIRSCASISTTCNAICTASTGNTGTIVGGPQQADNYTWWQISWDNGTGNCSNGTTGWSVENYLEKTSGTVQITVITSPTGLSITVDGSSYTSPQIFNWSSGSSHTISVSTPQYSSDAKTRYSYYAWSDGGSQTHTITTSSSNQTYEAFFYTAYLLDTSVNPNGSGSISLNPSGPWYNPNQSVQLTATANSGYTFKNWSGDLSGSSNPATLTMNGPKSVTANFEIVPPHTVTAVIGSISPNYATQGTTVNFSGTGSDSSGHVITAYNWHSSLEGTIGTFGSFGKSDLKEGSHYIYFRVQCSNGTWSSEMPWPGNPLVITPSCTYGLINGTNAYFNASGGSGKVDVTTSSSSCSWTAKSNADWITITSGSSGTGNGTVSYSVSTYTGTSTRTGTMTIEGQTFTVTQYGISTPTVSSTNPGSDAVDVAIDTGITTTFSEEMDIATINTTTFIVNDGSNNIDGTVAYSNMTAMFTPSSPLAYSTTYTATITTGVTDAAGNAMTENYQWSFTTGASGTDVFTAYNDLSWSAGQVNNKITVYTTGQGGPLKDYFTGVNTPVTLTIAGGYVASGTLTQGSNANAGTDAYNIFNGIVNSVGLISYSATNLTFTFTGLDPDLNYEFVLFGNRNDAPYNNRSTTTTISDVRAFTNASTPGTVFSGATDPAVTIVNGDNTINGYVARFTNIIPGADGDILITVSSPTGKFYANALMLRATQSSDTTTLQIGDRVKATANLDIRSCSSATCNTICTASIGNTGTIVGGPQQSNNYTWWQISWDNGTGDCSSGTTGWSVENYLEKTSGTVQITVITSPTGLSITVDGSSYTSPQIFNWSSGSSHTISMSTPQYSSDAKTRYSYYAWSDGGSQTHTITTPSSNQTYEAFFYTAYLLDTSVNPNGSGSISLNPSGPWYDPNQSVQLTATANSGYTFKNWSGNLSGSSNPATLTMNGSKSVTAVYVGISANPVTVPYVSTNLTVDGNLDESGWDVATDVSNVVIGATNNTTTFGVLWDSTYLYVGMKVLDDNLYNDSTHVHEDDSVEIYIDGDHNHSTTYDSYDRQFIKGWNDPTLFGQHDKKTGVLHGWAPISGGYSIELAIPWSNLGVTPTAGMTIGFSVGYNDDDDGAGREGQAIWIGTENNYKDTSELGDIVLEANPNLITVPYVSTNLTVDGNVIESSWDITTDISRVVIGATNNTTTFGVLWDSTYLYVGMKVLDDNLYNDSTYVHEDDSVEIYIDGDHNHGTTYDSNDRQFIKGWNDETLFEKKGKKTGLLHGWAPISGGYSIELAIPWSNLGVTPTAGMTIGFSVGYNDDDDGARREGQAIWIGTENNYKDTSELGDIVLGEAPPEVGATNPVSNATGVAINSVITATFNEAMDSGSITPSTFLVSDGSGTIGGTVSYNDTTATFTPSSPLAYSTTYTATITTGVMDAAGNPMAANYQWSFTTGISGTNLFTAYNDLAWSAGQVNNKITLYTTGQGGLLKDYLTGANTPVTLTIAGGYVVSGTLTQGSNANTGTDAYNIFNGIVNSVGLISYSATNLTFTFTGLDPDLNYEFVLFGNRNDAPYNNRSTTTTISDVRAFTNASTPGTVFSGATDPAVTIVNGDNTITGYVARFTNIIPGADGDILITVSSPTGKFYANALMLRATQSSEPTAMTVSVTDVAGNSNNGVLVDDSVRTTGKIDDIHKTPETGITLKSFRAKAGRDGRVTLHWETPSETDTAGFNLYRSRRKSGKYTKVNNVLINSRDINQSGERYTFTDEPGSGRSYYYKLEQVDYYGENTPYHPIKVRVKSPGNE